MRVIMLVELANHVGVLMLMAAIAVIMRMGVIDVLVAMIGVRVRMPGLAMAVLVCVDALVSMFVGHRFSFCRVDPRLGTEMIKVAQRLVQEGRDVRVVQGVDRGPTQGPANNQAEIPQDPQLVGHRRLRHLDRCGKRAHRTRCLAELSQDLDTTRRRQSRHQSSDPPCVATAERPGGSHAVSHTHVDMFTCTCVHVQSARNTHSRRMRPPTSIG